MVNQSSFVPRAVVIAFAFSLAAQRARAQCVGEWMDDFAFPAPGGDVESLLIMPDGKIVVGGRFQFSTSGGLIRNIATFTGGVWFPLGGGISSTSGLSPVTDLAPTAADGIVAVGQFNSAGGVPVNNIATWDGNEWHSLGTGLWSTEFPAEIKAVVRLQNGDIIAAGLFNRAGGVAVNNIARWDGSEWHRLGNGINGDELAYVDTLEELSNGDVLAGGYFQYAGVVAARHIACWDGEAWHALGSGPDHTVEDLLELPSGDLLAATGRDPRSDAPQYSIVRWDGESWHTFADRDSLGHRPIDLALLPNGILVVAGDGRVTIWNGLVWERILSQSYVRDFAVLPNGDLLAGGDRMIGLPTAFHVGHWRQYVEPTICAEPADREPCLGGSTSFQVVAGGDAPLTYQWQRNEIDLFDAPGSVSGANTPSLTLENAAFSDEGDRFRCIISDDSNTVITRIARLSICIGQLNCVGGINLADLAILLTHFGTPTGATYFDGDLNLDGAVDLPDLALLLQRFGTRCD